MARALGCAPPAVKRSLSPVPDWLAWPKRASVGGTTSTNGDFNGDGYKDAVVGVPNEGISTIAPGAFNVIFGSTNGLSTTGSQFWHQNKANVLGANKNGDAYGASFVVGRFGGGTQDDLAIGSQGRTCPAILSRERGGDAGVGRRADQQRATNSGIRQAQGWGAKRRTRMPSARV